MKAENMYQVWMIQVVCSDDKGYWEGEEGGGGDGEEGGGGDGEGGDNDGEEQAAADGHTCHHDCPL